MNKMNLKQLIVEGHKITTHKNSFVLLKDVARVFQLEEDKFYHNPDERELYYFRNLYYRDQIDDRCTDEEKKIKLHEFYDCKSSDYYEILYQIITLPKGDRVITFLDFFRFLLKKKDSELSMKFIYHLIEYENIANYTHEVDAPFYHLKEVNEHLDRNDLISLIIRFLRQSFNELREYNCLYGIDLNKTVYAIYLGFYEK